jgi:hypothetical protein
MDRLTRRLKVPPYKADCAYCTSEYLTKRGCSARCPLRREQKERLAAYEDTGLTPEEATDLAQAKRDGRCVVLPCKVGDTVDKLFSHNEIIALWYDKPNDRDGSYFLWRGEAWRLPENYKPLRLLRFFGTVPERISEADTINILVTPYVKPAYTPEAAEAALKERSGE